MAKKQGRLKLDASSKFEKTILEYLELNASDSLAERINTEGKTIKQCCNYIMSEAKKEAVSGCACITDEVVFGWAIHFFEEADIDGSKFDKVHASAKVATSEEKDTDNEEAPKKAAPLQKKKQPPKEDNNQTSLFDLL